MSMYLLDTDFIINYFNGKDKNIELMKKIIDEKNSKIFISSITSYELVGGAYVSMNFEKNYGLYSKLKDNVEILDFDEKCALTAAKIYSVLRKKGKTVDDTDILIASICINNECALITENIKHFKEIDGLKLKSI